MSRLPLVAPLATTLLLTLGSCSPGDDRPAFPSRPVDIRTSEIDPCAMFSPAQRSELGLRKATPSQATVNGLPSAGCVWLGGTGLGYNTQTIPVGAELAVTDPGAIVVQINGFGAVRSVVRDMTGGAPTCQVTIDAAPGQSIRVQAQASAGSRSDDEMCRLATDAASMVMTTVTAPAQ